LLASLIVSPSIALADTVVRGFKSSASLTPGWIVAIDKNDGGSVVKAPANDPTRIYGVVIDSSEAPIVLQKDTSQVFVATSGDYSVLVSAQNGDIRTGDFVSTSSTDGIGAKATSQSYVVGKALGNFNGASNVLTRAADGAAVGKIKVALGPSKNPVIKENNSLPAPLRRLGEAIAGKVISALRIYAALGIFIVTALIATVLLLGGIKNGMMAIGRNPLSRHVIMRGLAQVLAASAFVFIVGLFGIYLLLRL